tara:strand:- start:707 stop:913 length:207 start_codon:yes stop_codon:yes gene_type:complete
MEEYRDELTSQEAFNLAKEYEIETWKEQIDGYKCEDYGAGFNTKDAIKMCKTMINELSKIKTTDILNK